MFFSNLTDPDQASIFINSPLIGNLPDIVGPLLYRIAKRKMKLQPE